MQKESDLRREARHIVERSEAEAVIISVIGPEGFNASEFGLPDSDLWSELDRELWVELKRHWEAMYEIVQQMRDDQT